MYACCPQALLRVAHALRWRSLPRFSHPEPLSSRLHPQLRATATAIRGPCFREPHRTYTTAWSTHTTHNMDTSSDSSLTPPPDSLPSATDTVAAAGAPSAGRKRKASAATKPPTKRTKKSGAPEADTESGVLGAKESGIVKASATAKKSTTRKKKVVDDEDGDEHVEVKAKIVKRKIQVLKKLEPLAVRTQDTQLRVGAHVSAAGGVHNSLTNLLHIGANAFALFLKQHRKWDSSELDPEAAQLFIDGCKEHKINPGDSCLPHGSYLVNLAHPDPIRKKQAYDSFLNDLKRCNKLGIKLYNFHPGNANAGTREEGLRMIAQNLNEAHQDPDSGKVITLLETMATMGNTIGGTFEDLASIIELVEDKSRVGVCLDTCHVFAAGYDLRTPEAYATTMEQFDKIIGLEYLKAFHVNDSKAPLFSNRDLHARIGTGYLGLGSFHNLVNDTRFHGLPMVLETPCEVIRENGEKVDDKGVWAREIKMLEMLVGMDVESDTFKELEAKLQEEGDAERKRVGDQVDRKNAKAVAPKKAMRKGKKKVESEEEE
ncbi:AP endonuclease [Plenodomus tracheiphilus IPT5]|uniref:Apurinic-apyrimidinic endonuclease 1 n=1 Tax=Plenodomus tracheiphilus IPT5 TaxID=1408161 RepID=A0A6A7AQA7_9PLEO|nr:AP endonuclease [Plenodomus tracheiphilus IPT5]